MKKHFLLLISLLCFHIFFLHAQTTLFSLMPPDSTGVYFMNIIKNTTQLNVVKYEYYYNGGGVAIGDVNNDGLADLYFTSNVNECKLYLNQGNLKFKDVTVSAGVGAAGGYHTGVTMVDLNNDGWMDIYVCQSVATDPKARRNIFFENNKDGTFTDKALQYGIADEGISVMGYFNDLDGDGDLDLLVINDPYNIDFAKTIRLTYDEHNQLVAKKDTITQSESDQYYENVNGHFVNKTKEAGLETHSFGLSAILQDFNNDGLVDIYQANDYLKPDYLFINQGNGKFVNEFDKFFKHSSYSSMGSEYADINNDGLCDLMTDDMLPEGNERQKQLRGGNNYDEFEKVVKYGYGYQYVKNVLQLNNGNGSYSDISYFTGMAYSEWSWAILAADFDNDEWKDIYISNGYLNDITDMDYVKFKMDSIKKVMIKVKDDTDVVKLISNIPQVRVLKCYFKNYGGYNFKREIKSTGLDQYAWSFGAAYADLDNDGDLDFVVNNTNDFPFIYKNNTRESGQGNSIRIQLHGSDKNINGIGTKIETVTPDRIKQTLIFNPEKGYLSSSDKIIIVGTGNQQTANLSVTWPDGKQQHLNNMEVNKLIDIKYTEAKDTVTVVQNHATPFQDITAKTKVNFTYNENPYIDFKLEPLLPHRFSQLGPCVTVADFNGDHLDDFFVGGAKDNSAAIYIQNTEGTFSQLKESVFESDKIYEDGDATTFDFDHDGDLDLIVTSGGNDYPNDNSKYPVRLYLNDGKGNFSKGKSSNKFFTSSNSIAVTDFNKDGNIDIFIGGKTVPGHYGLIPKSFLLTVTGDSLTDITNQTNLQYAGMLSTAVWCDINGDGWNDLVTAGEWMPVALYLNNNGNMSGVPTIIDNTYGWWNKIIAADIDNDGDIDLIGGNLGMNTRYKGTLDKPVTMVVSDFDGNGSTDCLISTFVKGKSYPIAIRDYTLDQMPYLRKKYLRYSKYSTATVTDIFTEEQLAKADKYSANDMYSTAFINDGKGTFAKVNLPAEAQFFPIKGIQLADVNNDGLQDLLLAGNDYSTEVETGRNDAGIGLVLINSGGGAFYPLTVTQSGFYIPGDTKCLEKISINNKSVFIAGKNKDALQFIELEK